MVFYQSDRKQTSIYCYNLDFWELHSSKVYSLSYFLFACVSVCGVHVNMHILMCVCAYVHAQVETDIGNLPQALSSLFLKARSLSWTQGLLIESSWPFWSGGIPCPHLLRAGIIGGLPPRTSVLGICWVNSFFFYCLRMSYMHVMHFDQIHSLSSPLIS